MSLVKEKNISSQEPIGKKQEHHKIFTMENLLCFFIIICPILDVSSFVFRNIFNTNISISTFVRPIIPALEAA